MELSSTVSTTQSVRSASSYRTRRAASAPLSSLPCTLPATHKIAGVEAIELGRLVRG